MTVFMETWHRVAPHTTTAHERFCRYYADHVVNANPELLDVVGGWRFVSGPSSCDVVLYRYESISHIDRTLAAFGDDPEFVRATEKLFESITLEEFRSVAVPLPFSDAKRVERIARGKPRTPRRYVRIRRRPRATNPLETHRLLGELVAAREDAGPERLVLATQNVIGDVMLCSELWVLPEGATELPLVPERVDPQLLASVEECAPEAERAGLEPLDYSRLR